MYRFISESILSKVAGSDQNLRMLFSASGITNEGLTYLFIWVNGSDAEKTALDIRSGKAARIISDRLTEDIVLAALEDKFCYTARMRGGDWWSDAKYMNYLSSKFFAKGASAVFASKAMLEASGAIDRLVEVCQTKSTTKILAKFIGKTGIGTLDLLETAGKKEISEIAAAYGSGSEAELGNAIHVMVVISGRLRQLKRD